MLVLVLYYYEHIDSYLIIALVDYKAFDHTVVEDYKAFDYKAFDCKAFDHMVVEDCKTLVDYMVVDYKDYIDFQHLHSLDYNIRHWDHRLLNQFYFFLNLMKKN